MPRICISTSKQDSGIYPYLCIISSAMVAFAFILNGKGNIVGNFEFLPNAISHQLRANR